MRILAIQPFLRGQILNPAAGGKNKVALVLARRLAAEGHQVFLLPWKGERYTDPVWIRLGDDGEQATALPTLRLPGTGTGGRILRRFLADRDLPLRPVRRLREAVKEELLGRRRILSAAIDDARPDLIHVHETHSDAGAVYRRLGRRPPILLTHHTLGLAEGCDDYDYVVFVSRRQRREALARWPRLAARSSVIYYFAEPEFFRPHRPRASEDLVFVGNLEGAGKGLDLLIEAWARHPALHRLRLRVVGEGRLRGQLEETARKRGLPFTFAGRLSAAAIAELHAGSAAYVQPSRGEGMPLAYLEALCMGLPILGFGPCVDELSDLLGISCGVAHDAATDPVDELAARILGIADGQGEFTLERRIEMQERARALFSRQRFESEYLELYEALLSGGRGRAR